jgi:hypothetical protein
VGGAALSLLTLPTSVSVWRPGAGLLFNHETQIAKLLAVWTQIQPARYGICFHRHSELRRTTSAFAKGTKVNSIRRSSLCIMAVLVVNIAPNDSPGQQILLPEDQIDLNCARE